MEVYVDASDIVINTPANSTSFQEPTIVVNATMDDFTNWIW